MKNLVLSAVAVFLFVLNSFAQQYIPMPTSDAMCAYIGHNYGASGSQLINYLLIINGEDTIINGKSYKKIMIRYAIDTVNHYKSIADYPDKFYAGIREDNKKVYVSFADGNSYLPKASTLSTDTSKDRLLYDFNVGIGDTIPSPGVRGFPKDIITVTSIDSVLVGSQYHKMFRTSDGPNIIEGIGTTGGLFYYQSFQHTAVSFECFSQQQNLFPSSLGPSCYYIYSYGTPSSIANAETESGIKIYPNPVYDKLNIEAANATSIRIYNNTGSLVTQQNIEGGKLTLDVSAFPAAVYFLDLKHKDGSIIHRQKWIKY